MASVEKAFVILQCLNSARKPLTLTQLMRMSGMDKSSIQRFTHTLRTLGYIAQHPLSRAYVLSSRMLEFGQTVLSTDPVREIAQRHLDRLSQNSRETTNLIKLEGDEIIYISRFAGQHPVSVNLHVGSRLPAYCTAAGRAILAYLPEDQALKLIMQADRKPMTDRTTTDPADIVALLQEIRQVGYALNDQEAFVGDISIAAPIFNAANFPVAAINIAVTYPRWQAADVRRMLGPMIKACARAISTDVAQFG